MLAIVKDGRITGNLQKGRFTPLFPDRRSARYNVLLSGQVFDLWA